MESDLLSWRLGFQRRIQQRHDLLDDVGYDPLMKVQPPRQRFLQSRQFASQVLLGYEHSAHLYEGAHDEDAHLDSFFAPENVRGHDGPVFGESMG